MTEREKIIDVLNKNFTQDVECTPIYTTAQGKEVALPQELCDIFNDIVTQAVIPYFADALIAAGIVDKSDYASMKETAVRYKAEVSKAGARAKEAEHRAEVAEHELERRLAEATKAMYVYERALYYATLNGETADEVKYNDALKRAQKDFAENKGD